MKMVDKIKRVEAKHGDMNKFMRTVPMGEMTTEEMIVALSFIGLNHGEGIDALEERISEVERVLTCQEYDNGGGVSVYG